MKRIIFLLIWILNLNNPVLAQAPCNDYTIQARIVNDLNKNLHSATNMPNMDKVLLAYKKAAVSLEECFNSIKPKINTQEYLEMTYNIAYLYKDARDPLSATKYFKYCQASPLSKKKFRNSITYYSISNREIRELQSFFPNDGLLVFIYHGKLFGKGFSAVKTDSSLYYPAVVPYFRVEMDSLNTRVFDLRDSLKAFDYFKKQYPDASIERIKNLLFINVKNHKGGNNLLNDTLNLGLRKMIPNNPGIRYFHDIPNQTGTSRESSRLVYDRETNFDSEFGPDDPSSYYKSNDLIHKKNPPVKSPLKGNNKRKVRSANLTNKKSIRINSSHSLKVLFSDARSLPEIDFNRYKPFDTIAKKITVVMPLMKMHRQDKNELEAPNWKDTIQTGLIIYVKEGDRVNPDGSGFRPSYIPTNKAAFSEKVNPNDTGFNALQLINLTSENLQVFKGFNLLKKRYFKNFIPVNEEKIIVIYSIDSDLDFYNGFTNQLHFRAANNNFGYYNPYDNSIVYWKGFGLGTTYHEAIHLLIHNNNIDCPYWLNEGIASLYETTESLEPINNWRLNVIKDYFKKNQKHIAINELVDHASLKLFNKDIYDAYSRYFCFFLYTNAKLGRAFIAIAKKQEQETSEQIIIIESLLKKRVNEIQKDWENWLDNQ